MVGNMLLGRSAAASPRYARWLGLAALVVGFMVPVGARETANQGALPSVELAALPVQARDVHALVLSGGPFPYSKDGSVFGNRERLLPSEARGYYREYTVRTPGLRHRGARRLVCGGRQVTAPKACYYTEDHYASFRRVVP